jgi:hypothetical protein
MIRLILLSIVLAGTGCMGVKPVGPLADALGTNRVVPVAPEIEPEVRSAPKPTPPALYVTPGEVTPATAADAAKRLQQELEIDRRALEAMPKISEVERVTPPRR